MNTWLGICFLRTPPQDLPGSQGMLYAALFAYALTDVIGVLDVLSLEKALLASVVDTVLLLAATHLVLQWRKLEYRFPQTLSALAGCGALLSLLAWAIAGLTRGWISPEWVWAPFLVWYILVFGHVLRHALNLSLAAGVAVSFIYLFLSMGVTGLFVDPVPVAN